MKIKKWKKIIGWFGIIISILIGLSATGLNIYWMISPKSNWNIYFIDDILYLIGLILFIISIEIKGGK